MDLDNAMIDRQHFISGWNQVWRECVPIIEKRATLGPAQALGPEQMDKFEKDCVL